MNAIERLDAGIDPQFLYYDGHNVFRGHMVCLQYQIAAPVKIFVNGRRARRFVDKFNGIQAIRHAKILALQNKT
jgi:hypothetical protein